MLASRVGAVVGVVAGLQACNDISGPDLDYRKGMEIGSARNSAPFRWQLAGEELTFVSVDGRTAFAYQMTSGVTRQLFQVSSTEIDRVGSEEIRDVQFSTSMGVFFSESRKSFPTGWRGLIRRHTATGATVLTDSGGGLLVARDQDIAAFVVIAGLNARLYVSRRGEEPRLIGSGCQYLISFSPDSSRVLCLAGYPAGLVQFDLNGGSSDQLALPTDGDMYAAAFHWDATGIKVLYSTQHGAIVQYDVTTGSSRVLVTPLAQPHSGPAGLTLSSDGRKAAYWRNYCRSENAYSCAEERDDFYVLDVASGTTTWVAKHGCYHPGVNEPNCYGARISISPTGSAVAYAVTGRLFVLSVR